MQLLQGRDFGTEETQGGKTVIINQLFARAFFPGQDPIGHRISVGLDPLRQNLEIVGVVEDAKYQTLQEEPRRIAYLPVQMNRIQDLFVVVRAETSLSALAAAVRREVQSLDRSVPVTIQTVEDRIRETLMPERVVAILSAVSWFVGVRARIGRTVRPDGVQRHTAHERDGPPDRPRGLRPKYSDPRIPS